MFPVNANIFILVTAFLLIHYTRGNYQDDLEVIDSIRNEGECTMQGGSCVMADDCPELTAVKGLCPTQRNMGVECCYGISVKETRCRKRGGECFADNKCPPMLQEKMARDCADDQVCCILV